MNIAGTYQLRRSAFEQQFKSDLVISRARCTHDSVGHFPNDGEVSGRPVRVCFDCGLEEVGGWWCMEVDCSHWHQADDCTASYSDTVLKRRPNRTIREITREEWLQARVL